MLGFRGKEQGVVSRLPAASKSVVETNSRIGTYFFPSLERLGEGIQGAPRFSPDQHFSAGGDVSLDQCATGAPTG